MANVKITELTAITAPASSDVLAIVDVDADVTKKVTIANLVGSAAPGSFGAPSFGFADDDDTGMYRAAADQLGFATTGAERFRIDDAGNLHISGDSKYLYLSSDDNQWIRADASTDFIQIGTSNSERLRIDSSGRVLINRDNSTGSHNLEVHGGTDNEPVKISSSDEGAYIAFADDGTTGSTRLGAVDNDLKIDVNSAERLRIDSSGRLLVGTSSGKSVGAGQYAPLNVQGYIGSAAGGGELCLSRGEAASSITAGDQLGAILFTDSAGYGFGSINCKADGTAGSSDYPGRLEFKTAADGSGSMTERMRIDSSGNVGINNSNPSSSLHINGDQQFGWAERRIIHNFDNSYRSGIAFSATNRDLKLFSTTNDSGGTITFNTRAGTGSSDTDYGTERMRITSSGRVGIGLTSPSAKLDVKVPGNNYTDGQNTFGVRGPDDTGLFVGTHYDGGGAGCDLVARGYASGMGDFRFQSVNGSYLSPVERMRIDGSGRVLIGTEDILLYNNGSGGNEGAIFGTGHELQMARQSAEMILLNRMNSDGSLIGFYQNGSLEGTISVSGSTVSYNGAHLARWSQLPSNAERTEILRGSVLSNLDEMCEWGDEDNEQLNRMQVSSVEGDPNVSGVFQAWDDDDDTYTNDFYCAMTGDFIIRIAQGTTVARGDLLMSAGDGTAKPQDDDIVRSKTIAKVTSTTVSETYSDGSYCVPCVLMAC